MGEEINQPRKFCNEQEILHEDVGKGTYSCLAHLDSGRCFQCYYKESDIKVMDEYEKQRYRFEIQKDPQPGADGICRDFKIMPKVKKDLIAKVVSELEKS